ncbi:MAG: isopentenyl phosphate kinase family protein [Theionarchaea archaeon]|nr:isopentenyl phosphate kinase family protein [Theionarchaea archaeon]MBU7001263.1 isopentenyl phosphate kinase family protein [Theionarchaea archaeon]MBU7019872.1 isopentenyl phosphate kinase family protein [Theionarchaea archaeon]MBU7035272.1 isopentenyl phosphate kinase family protein [Theionarchaea archaeon]MBU7040932.1 isopentenyl phosphate kinase family protein [Theionarchaea archaeon]
MIIVKLGGSAVTDKSKDFTPRLEVIENAAKQISSISEQILLVHGGGSYGHPLAREYSLHEGFSHSSQLSGVSQTRYSMTQLNQIILSILLRHGVKAVSVQPSACFVCTNKRISHRFLEPIEGLLTLGCTPVLYGDVVTDQEMGFCILSGDQIVSHLAGALSPRKVIFGLEVDGLYTEDPRNESARLVKDITFADLKSISAGEVGDVTKGMKGKLQEITEICGIEVDLINLMGEETLVKAVSGEVDGTRIH